MRIYEIQRSGHVEDLKVFLNEQCRPWLDHTANGQMWVYRGVSYVSLDIEFFVRDIRKDRRPLGSPEYRDMYNKMLSDLGAVAQRYNSVSVTSNHSVAEEFGDVFVFVPVGDFHYTWSTVLVDWGSFEVDDTFALEEYKDEMRQKHPEMTHLEIHRSYIEPTVKFDDFSAGALAEAIASGHEISIAASSGLYVEFPLYREIITEIQMPAKNIRQ